MPTPDAVIATAATTRRSARPRATSSAVKDDGAYNQGVSDARVDFITQRFSELATSIDKRLTDHESSVSARLTRIEAHVEGVKTETANMSGTISNNYVSRPAFSEWRDNLAQDTQNWRKAGEAALAEHRSALIEKLNASASKEAEHRKALLEKITEVATKQTEIENTITTQKQERAYEKGRNQAILAAAGVIITLTSSVLSALIVKLLGLHT